MKFALACHGSRGDVEPSAAVGRELLRRGHEVCMGVPPDLVEFASSAGLNAVSYGLDTRSALDGYRKFWATAPRRPWRIGDFARSWRDVFDTVTSSYGDVSASLERLTDGADVLFSGLVYEDLAANVAERLGIPFATLHFFPVRVNGHLHPRVPGPVMRTAMKANERFSWLLMKRFENAQRERLQLARATSPPAKRIGERGSLELQAYDEVFFPEVAAEFAKSPYHRPFVGALTLDLSTDADDDVDEWIDRGRPPIYFGFGSNPVDSPRETLSMISSVCEELDERALICSGWNDYADFERSERVKVVSTVSFSRVFPRCRVLVHHGGAGTVAAGLRAGVPALILWTLPDQPIWAAQLNRLGAGQGRRFSRTTRDALLADLREVLAPDYSRRAREAAASVTEPATSVAKAADLLEKLAVG